ncbi:unnamed protein product [Linum tenue]|uniref:TF-B3 domain-containing protein n=1 Tax=Linum tenue TaxID=586396 RepID=A0AAV0IV08_9ROSI|nr:unnamed protein product [Linum tenue]
MGSRVDAAGKVWRFRYSYWKQPELRADEGWSRFVKEKGLKAGDIVSFQRSAARHEQQLYIHGLEDQDGGGSEGGDGCNGKRSVREMEVVAFEYCSKKQRFIGAL